MSKPVRIDEKGEWYAAADAEEFNSDRFDFRWNEDFSEFRAVPLLWWDDASYIAYQCDPGEREEDWGRDLEVDEEAYRKVVEEEERRAAELAELSDGIPF